MDFFLWGYSKENVYKGNPGSIAELKKSIEKFTSEIPLEMCERVVRNFKKRVQACIRVGGSHFENMPL